MRVTKYVIEVDGHPATCPPLNCLSDTATEAELKIYNFIIRARLDYHDPAIRDRFQAVPVALECRTIRRYD